MIAPPALLCRSASGSSALAENFDASLLVRALQLKSPMHTGKTGLNRCIYLFSLSRFHQRQRQNNLRRKFKHKEQCDPPLSLWSDVCCRWVIYLFLN